MKQIIQSHTGERQKRKQASKAVAELLEAQGLTIADILCDVEEIRDIVRNNRGGKYTPKSVYEWLKGTAFKTVFRKAGIYSPPLVMIHEVMDFVPPRFHWGEK